MEIFGNHIENAKDSEEIALKCESNPINHLQRLSTTPLRELKPRKDTRVANNKFLKSICEKIKTVEDIFTIVSSIGFCIDGPVLSEDDFQRKMKMFVNPIKETLAEEYDI